VALLPANPGQGLWIGGAGGKNHYNVGIGLGTTGGQAHEDFGQDLIEEGFVYSIAGGTAPYNDADKFYLNATGNPVFRINAGAGRTSTNTAHPRSELRELLANGTTKAAWDGRTGIHYVRARYRINDVSANRPWVCFTQIHGSEISPETSDLVRVQTEGNTGTTTGLSIVCRRSPPAGGSEIVTTLRTGYDVGDWFTCELGMYDGRLKIFLDGVAVLDVANMGQIGNYFKTGCYMQDNVEKGSTANDFAEVEIERGSLVTWHTGYPNPTAPIFTGASDPEGGAGGGDGGPDTQAPTVPQDLVSLQDDEQITLIWSPSVDNVAVDHYNVYRFSDTGEGGGVGSSATVGKTTGGTSTTSSSTDKMVASRHTADADGTLTTGYFRARLSASGSVATRMFVYEDDAGAPGDLLATSASTTVTQTVETTQSYTFTGAEQIAIVEGTAYWIAVAWDDPGTPSLTYSRDSTASGRLEQTLTFPTAPDPFGTATGTFTGPIDAWIETVSEGTGGGTDTTLGKTSNGASNSTSSTDKVAVSSFTASGDGTLTTGGARVWMDAGSTLCRMVVLADTAGAPGNFLAVSDQVTLSATAEAEVAFTFSGSSQIAITSGTTYWVGVAWDDPGANNFTLSRDATASQRQETTVFTYPPTVGAAFGTPAAQTGPIDAYVNVTASAGYVLLAEATGTTYVDTGLTNGTEYSYVVSAEDAAGNASSQSLPVSDTPGPPDITAPSVPAGLNAVGGDRKVTLTWTDSTDDDSGVDHYKVYRDTVLIFLAETAAFTDRNVINGTLYSYTVSAEDVAGNESAQSSADTATPAAPPIAGVPWLIAELGADAKIGVEIAWGAELGADADNWTWTDVTDDVRHDPGISTSLGRNDESSTSNPASLSLVLDNTTGDYSLGGHSANWPYVRRNTPVRLRVDPDDGGGGRVVFFGFADGFTPGWARHNVPVVTLSASGTLRRLAQGDAPVLSAYRRVMNSTSSVMAYWPFEEGKDAEYAPAVRGAADMTIVTGTGFRGGPTGFGDPGWGTDDSFDCSDSLPTLRTGAFLAAVYPYPDTGSQQVRFLFSVPENGLPDGGTIIHIHAGTCQWGITYEINALGESALGVFRKVNGVEHSHSIIGFDVNGSSGRLPERRRHRLAHRLPGRQRRPGRHLLNHRGRRHQRHPGRRDRRHRVVHRGQPARAHRRHGVRAPHRGERAELGVHRLPGAVRAPPRVRGAHRPGQPQLAAEPVVPGERGANDRLRQRRPGLDTAGLGQDGRTAGVAAADAAARGRAGGPGADLGRAQRRVVVHQSPSPRGRRGPVDHRRLRGGAGRRVRRGRR
jgi:hypothetical protein